MDLNTATDLGRALRDRIGDAPLLLARDTRESGPALAKAVARGAGGEVLDLGVLPTPAASALLAESRANLDQAAALLDERNAVCARKFLVNACRDEARKDYLKS
ncbi:hypothetical protein L6R46_28440, partial [Myxococcota bacterium]|nr:hypothetical protein [Myxococcota bacterium]